MRSDRGEVDFEVAGLDDSSLLGIDADAIAIRDGVGDSKERDLKVVTDRDHGVAIILDDFDFFADAGILEFVSD